MLNELPCKIVKVKTVDGIALHGAQYESQSTTVDNVHEFDAAILMHGAGANFYSVRFYQMVAPLLLNAGMTVLCVNNRGHDLAYGASQGGRFSWQGAAFEHVGSAWKDIDAWLKLLEGSGRSRILLVGHSLGAIKVLHAQSLHAEEFQVNNLIRGIVACSPPRLSCGNFKTGPHKEEFLKSIENAREKYAAGRPDEIMRVTFPFPLLISVRNYIDKYGDEEKYNILRFVESIDVETLLLFGERELETNVSFQRLDDQLRAKTKSKDNFSHAIVENADHFYTGAAEELTREVRNWLA